PSVLSFPSEAQETGCAVDVNRIDRRPAMEPLAPTSGISGAPLPKGGSNGIGASQRTVATCHYVWPGRAVQDGLPRSTNVRAASMYQASEVEQFAPGHHGYPRASEAD